MLQQEKYTLTWYSYSNHLREALGEMMTSGDFADVTLVTDDKQQIRAHRSVAMNNHFEANRIIFVGKK